MPKTAPIRRRSLLLLGVLIAAVAGLVAVGAMSDPSDGSDRVAATPTTVSGPSTRPPALSTSTAPDSTEATTGPSASARRAIATLETLAVKGRAPRTGYEREQFGQAWSDDVTVADGHNGCDTRNDILRRDLTDIALKTGTRDCVVASGMLDDLYTGQRISFVRGEQTSAQVQIDHVVALSDAWQKGAQQLSAEQRRDFANDPRNLQAVAGAANQRKGDGDAATWLPPNKTYRCTYVSRQIAVKALYHLWVTQAEKDAMTRVLTECAGTTASTPATTTASTPPVTTADPSGYYPSCAAARAAGAAPLFVGQPGYRTGLDGDGVACE
ncbi:DUF1524 domain-containing protein [Gordonia sp. HNM0687]|uniref:DUF1524 domain-containing protein n=1 Tax=Gordonia mangrovi TaxID=2665643 RepID=A0A6L7GM95_9ACTN|nr:DUF1524 domain-containing protein [Gordonia mangrovi]MXP21030.1 DUF1524 domain-containing protein [Gordonia mangrovi]UVF78425.1 DUF1524 domain-containing protein [Gordonia mangrovi]